MAGCIGLIVFAYLMDSYSRKGTMLIAYIFSAFGFLGVALFSSTYIHLRIWFFVIGFGLYPFLFSIIIYLSEIGGIITNLSITIF